MTVDLAEEAEADLAGADQDNSHAKNHTNISLSAETDINFRQNKMVRSTKKDVMYNLIELNPIRSLGLIGF